MTRAEHLLVTLAEECNEVAQRCSKALRFGLTEVSPGHDLDNDARLMEEWYDLFAIIQLLAREHYVHDLPDMAQRIHAKQAKFEQYFEYSKSQGRVTE